ncbi:MAG TPA: hypothetical protein VMH39_01330 [Gemmatimonadaceae bacterium]|nr:hypothetical protein [Gemmatimonadaceae bacterium]
MSDEHERIIDDVVHALRNDAPIEPMMDERVMTVVRGLPRHGRRHVLSRLTRPRNVMVSPLSWGLIAAGALFFAAGAGAMVSVVVRARAASRVAVADTAKSVTFTVVAPNATKVAVVGSFNRWGTLSPAAQMKHQGGGVWTTTVPVHVGAVEYSFVVDDSLWMADPTAPRVIDNDFGLPKSAIIITPDQ